MKPLCIDLYAGLGGWTEGFLAEGYDCVGFDLEQHDYGKGRYPGHLVIQDVRTLHGSQFKNATVIVASPPCTEYSYMAMPWKRAKQIAAALRGHGAFPSGYTGSRTVGQLNELFDACFRIQREACEATCHCECWRCKVGGHCVRCDCFRNTGKYARHIPLIVENVKGAQPWVGRAKANFGSFYLWGSVGQVGRRVVAGSLSAGKGISPRSSVQKYPGFRFDGSGKSFQSESVKVAGQNWSRFKETGEVSPHWRMEATKLPSESGRHTDVGNGVRFTSRDCGMEGVKGFTPNGEPLGKNQAARLHGSKSPQRKAASAEIAKIPFPLAQYIAKCFKHSSKVMS